MDQDLADHSSKWESHPTPNLTKPLKRIDHTSSQVCTVAWVPVGTSFGLRELGSNSDSSLPYFVSQYCSLEETKALLQER